MPLRSILFYILEHCSHFFHSWNESELERLFVVQNTETPIINILRSVQMELIASFLSQFNCLEIDEYA